MCNYEYLSFQIHSSYLQTLPYPKNKKIDRLPQEAAMFTSNFECKKVCYYFWQKKLTLCLHVSEHYPPVHCIVIFSGPQYGLYDMNIFLFFNLYFIPDLIESQIIVILNLNFVVNQFMV